MGSDGSHSDSNNHDLPKTVQSSQSVQWQGRDSWDFPAQLREREDSLSRGNEDS